MHHPSHDFRPSQKLLPYHIGGLQERSYEEVSLSFIVDCLGTRFRGDAVGHSNCKVLPMVLESVKTFRLPKATKITRGPIVKDCFLLVKRRFCFELSLDMGCCGCEGRWAGVAGFPSLRVQFDARVHIRWEPHEYLYLKKSLGWCFGFENDGHVALTTLGLGG
eukprot:6107881-Amphidinium_carterae.1